MLRELHIKNLAIIDELTIEFGKGFNVLTGETGAGKSIIIGALSLALGERATSELIRSGEREAVVEAFFEIPPDFFDRSTIQFLHDIGIGVDEGLIMKRIISTQGRGRAYINNCMVNIHSLSELSRGLIDVHGQYEHQSLLSPESQLRMLDAYGGLLPERHEIRRLYERFIQLKEELSGLIVKEKERAQRIDLLRYQINEINGANLKIGEEGELLEEARILDSALRLTELANQAYDSLYLADTSCITTLSKIISNLKEIAGIDKSALEALKSLEEALPLLEETAYFLRDYRDGFDLSPQRLDSVQERLQLISGLKRKYGDSIEEVLKFKEQAERELNELEHSEERLEGLKAEIEKVRNRFTERSQELSKKRKSASKRLEHQVIKELSLLSMSDSQFSIHIKHEKGDDTSDGLKATPKGIDYVEFLISPNKGEELRPLSKIASGGELSRIMLALKGILTKGDNIPVLVFDEIDAGIGGMAAETVGRKLKSLSSIHQVICITHLPQIASYADWHLRIQKRIKGNRTSVEVKRIEKDERIAEIARMLSGVPSEVSIRHAKEMLRSKRNP